MSDNGITIPETVLMALEKAVRAETKTDQHMQDCAMFRLRLADDFKEIKETARLNRDESAKDIDRLSAEQKKQTGVLTLIVGGLIALSKVAELGLTKIFAHL